MTLEAVLAALHMVAILTLVVFLTSEAALCRSEWMNPAVVKRLARLDLIYGITAVVLLATGLARLYFGVKGLSWCLAAAVSRQDNAVRADGAAVHQAHAHLPPLAQGPEPDGRIARRG